MLMSNPRGVNLIFYYLIFYFVVLLLLAPFNLLSFDTYYYWEWSRHLDLSYYDGSPMIAYFIRLSTMLFGDTLFALSLVGIVCAALTSWIIYQTARLFLSTEASYIAMYLWLFSPFVTLDILKQTTYDTPLSLFWASTLFCAVKFITSDRIKWLYLLGVSIGLMMLSKYSGVVLILALFIFLVTTPYRSLFKTPHFYLVLLLAVIIFSPVIVWNYQHEWQSFLYQLTTHKLGNNTNPFIGIIKSFFYSIAPTLNFMLIPPFLCWLKQANYFSFRPKHTESKKIIVVNLFRLTCTTFLCFYLLTASQATVKNCWLVPYFITSACLGGFCFQTFHYRKSTFLLIAVYAVASLGILINNAPIFGFTTSKKLINYQLIQQFNAAYSQLPQVVLSPGWFEARPLFFLKNKPSIYTIECGSLQNQYALWSKGVNQQIKDKTIKEVLFIDPYNRIECVKKYFDQCVRLFTPTYRYKNTEQTFYAYTCSNLQGNI